MTHREVSLLEEKLKESGYVKYIQALSSSEDFGYFKQDPEKKLKYQIEFRFWDFRKYGESGVNEFGVDVIIIKSGNKRADLTLTYEKLNIDRIEKIAERFNMFCEENSIGI